MKLLNHTLLIFAWLLLGGVFLLAQSPENMSRDDLFEFYGGDVPQSDESDRQVQPPVNNSVSADHALRTNACAAGFIMNTPYNSNNGQRGCMFDITATNAVTIRCFEANLYAGTTADYEIYYRPGTHVGFENNAAAWTFLGGETGVTSAGNNVPTALNIPINILIPAGNTYSFYITNTFGAGTSYTDGTAVGNFLAADANLTVFEGVGKSYPFGLTFNVRNFNGTIFYDLGTVLDGEDMILEGLSTEKGTVLTWDLPQDQEFTALSVERSNSPTHFDFLAELDPLAQGSFLDETASQNEPEFYRLAAINFDGQVKYSKVVEVRPGSGQEAFQIAKTFPNPFTTQSTLYLDGHREMDIEISIFDQMGRKVFQRDMAMEKGRQKISLDLQDLSTGVYTLQCVGGGHQEVARIVRR